MDKFSVEAKWNKEDGSWFTQEFLEVGGNTAIGVAMDAIAEAGTSEHMLTHITITPEASNNGD